jgi:hypothetical protein
MNKPQQVFDDYISTMRTYQGPTEYDEMARREKSSRFSANYIEAVNHSGQFAKDSAKNDVIALADVVYMVSFRGRPFARSTYMETRCNLKN